MEITKAWSYFVVTAPGVLAVSLADVKSWLKITGSAQDAEITALIESATLVGEKSTKRDFINKTYETFRDGFSDYPISYGSYAALVPGSCRAASTEIEIRRSRLQSVEWVKYLKDGVLTLVDSSVYYNTQESDFSSIALNDGESWPGDADIRKQAVKIEFIAGYGAADTNVPEDLKTAIKMHVANAFANRGDCTDGRFLPPGATAIYNQYRIIDIA